MSISIIITTYNGARFLSATVESVLAQTVGDWELVIVDDGSTDTTLELAQCYVERDPRIRLVRVANRIRSRLSSNHCNSIPLPLRRMVWPALSTCRVSRVARAKPKTGPETGRP